MSSRDEYIQNFITLVETQWPLFADCQEELEQLVEKLPSDTRKISNEIAAWCKSHLKIRDAMDTISQQPQSDRTPGSKGNPPPPPDPKLYQEMLKNTIRRQKKKS